MDRNGTMIEPYLMAILASRIGNISKQMNNIMIRSARSSVLALGRDCSTAICDGKGDVLVFPTGFPSHTGAASLVGRSLLEIHGDQLKAGDAYLHNSPYHGNSHPADYTILVPVMYDGKCIFICFCKGHQADIGNSQPTTYSAKAKDVYEEGAIIWPGVRVQKDYKDVQDIIRIAKMRIRVPNVWYGDYLAMLGAARIGERELTKLIEKYGKDTIGLFIKQWHEYGKQRMIHEIKKLPAGSSSYETTHDPLPGILPDGVTVKVNVKADPNKGIVECDFMENEDSKPCGLNMCEATLTSAARYAVLCRICAPDLPHCEGALSRIIVKMRKGSIVGKAQHPFSSSVATTNVADRAFTAVLCAFNQITDRLSMAEPHYDQGVSLSVISGKDSRYGNKSYITQMVMGYSGGGGINGHDGYLHMSGSGGGMWISNPIEMMESKYPVLFLEQEILLDGIGSGKWDGSPAVKTIIRTMADPVTFMYVADGHFYPSKGAEGGYNGVPAQAMLFETKDGIETKFIKSLPTFPDPINVEPGKAIGGIYSSGGGFGDPLERDPMLVRHRVNEGWISVQKAADAYGVVLKTVSEGYAVDRDETEKCRRKLQSHRNRIGE